MKKIILMTFLISLYGCANTKTPVERHFPKVPVELQDPCPDNLKQIDPKTTKLSDVVGTVINNYGQYHECSIKVKGWIEWYNTQKTIFDSVK
jgi:hypothetical protein